jgi:hypothetical protein
MLRHPDKIAMFARTHPPFERRGYGTGARYIRCWRHYLVAILHYVLGYNFAVRIFITLVLLSAAAKAQPSIQSVSNAASYQQTFSPGSVAAVFGKGFGTTPTVKCRYQSGLCLA